MRNKLRIIRIARVFFLMFRDFAAELRLINRHGYDFAQAHMRPSHERRARELYAIALDYGGVFIKLCQFFSARRDIFPDCYIKTLSGLQDRVPPVPFDAIARVLTEEYGDFSDRFTSVDPTPVASASIAQVHRATLATGEAVILKIQKPGIAASIDIDFAILYFVFRFISSFPAVRRHADFMALLDELIRTTGDELNFHREAWIAGRFREHFKKFDWVTVPRIWSEHTTSRVIVMDHVDGDPVSDRPRWISRNNDPVTIARRAITLYVEQFLYLRIVHYDPHPGNILIRDNCTIALIDFGMAGEVSEPMRDGIRDALEAVNARNYRGFIDALDRLGFIRSGINRYALLPLVEFFIDKILTTIRFDRESIHTFDLKPIFNRLADILYLEPVVIPADWAFIGKTVGTLSGIIASLYPDFNVYQELKPHAERLIRDSSKKILFKKVTDFKSTLDTLAALPPIITSFLNNLDSETYRFKVDYREMIEKIDELKQFVVRMGGFLIGSIGATVSVTAHLYDEHRLLYVFAPLSAIGFLVSLAYRKKNYRDKLREYL